jgi:hypothetical protein
MTTAQKAAPPIVVIAVLGLPAGDSAAQFMGAWAPDADKCDKVFVRRGRAQEMQALVFGGQ